MASYGTAQDGNRHRRCQGIPVNRIIPLLGCWACLCLGGGGAFFGIATWVRHFADSGYITDDASFMTEVGTWTLASIGSFLSCHTTARLGPRWAAICGIFFLMGGYLTLALLPAPTSPVAVVVGCGVVCCGSYHVLVAGLQFALLFPENVGVVDGSMLTMFELSGLLFLFLDLSDVSISGFSWTLFALTALPVFVTIFVLFPDITYQLGDKARITQPSLRGIEPFWYLGDYAGVWHTALTLRMLLFFGFYVWCIAMVTYVASMVPSISGADDTTVLLLYTCAALFAPLFGWLMDSCGFGLVSLATLLTTQVSVLLLLSQSATVAWVNLFIHGWSQTMLGTLLYVFLHRNFPAKSFPVLLFVLTLSQVISAFLCMWMELADSSLDIKVPVFVLVVPSCMLFSFPVHELYRYGLASLVPKEDTLIEVKPSD